MLNPKRTAFVIHAIIIVFLLLGVGLIGSWHHHGDGMAHPNCFICSVYAGLANVIVPAAAILPIIVACLGLPQSVFAAAPVEAAVLNKTPRSPPVSC